MNTENKKIQNYRGVWEAIIVNVKEGSGTAEDPVYLEEYVLFKHVDGTYQTHGKVVRLTPEERAWFN